MGTHGNHFHEIDKTEADMCSAFIAWVARFDGWTAYPETSDWDILLAHADGTQIGVQAKLKFNMAVLTQAAEWGGVSSWPDRAGPDFRAILIPNQSGARGLISALGLTEFYSNTRGDSFSPDLNFNRYGEPWHYCNPPKRHALPRYVPDVSAGVPAPVTLTPWKIAALEIAAIIELRGFCTREDFKQARIDHRRWVQSWLEPADLPGIPGAWRWRHGAPQPFQQQHPEVYPQVLADVAARLSALGAVA